MLYSEHIEQCNEYAQTGPDELARTVTFVLATIQQQLETVPRIVTEFVELGSASAKAFGSKANGLDWLKHNKGKLYTAAMLTQRKPRKLLNAFLAVPGLGLVKAGFAAQLFANQVGCLDLHNIKLYDIPLSALRYGYKLKPETQRKKQQTYVDLCKALGGSAALWTRWCDYLATLRPNNWANGEEVSQFHVDVVTGKEDGTIVDLFTGIDEQPRFKQGG